MPDLKYQINDMIVTEDRVVMRDAMTGTKTGELLGEPPRGRPAEVNLINIEKIRDGHITERWRVTTERQMGKLQRSRDS